MGDSLEDPTARNHAVSVRTVADHVMADHAVAVRLAVDHAAGDLTVAVHAADILADHIVVDSPAVHTAAAQGVDSLAAHMVEVLTEVAHTEAAHMAMVVIAKSELEHPDLGIHHTTYFAH